MYCFPRCIVSTSRSRWMLARTRGMATAIDKIRIASMKIIATSM